MKCPRCNVHMIEGKAIEPPELARYLTHQRLINRNYVSIITVLKCPRCGHSDDGKGENYVN